MNFSILSRKAAKLREVPREQKKKKSTLDVMVAKRNGTSPDGINVSQKRNVEESVKVYKEALQLYKDKIKTKNPSYFAGAYQNVATALIDCRKYVEAEKYFIEGKGYLEKGSKQRKQPLKYVGKYGSIVYKNERLAQSRKSRL